MLICNKYAILELCNLVVSDRKNNNSCGKRSTHDNAYIIHTRYLEQSQKLHFSFETSLDRQQRKIKYS